MRALNEEGGRDRSLWSRLGGLSGTLTKGRGRRIVQFVGSVVSRQEASCLAGEGFQDLVGQGLEEGIWNLEFAFGYADSRLLTGFLRSERISATG